MMNKRLQYILLSSVFLSAFGGYAQKQDENIGTEVVNVVKPYTPTISDAFKVKETPSLDDEETAKRETIQYTIFSFPVASTFTPAKGKAAAVEQDPKARLFSNYATLAAGNYGNVNGELFLNHNFEDGNYFGLMLRHLSSQGGIKNVELDDKFSNTSLDLTYGGKSSTMSWAAEGGYQRQAYRWYGINSYFTEGLTPEQADLFYSGIEPKQVYQTLYAGGRLGFNQGVFKEAVLRYTRFSDRFDSAENRVVLKPSFAFPVAGENIGLDVVFDYLNGSFARNYAAATEINYGFANIGVQPSFQLTDGDFSAQLGAAFFYSAATEGGESRFFIYPKINVSYKVVGDIMVAYAGAEGNLKQNAYRDFVQENFFVSPTLVITPTDQKYDIFVGLKGKLANTIGYNVRASYLTEDNRALFTSNTYDSFYANPQGYNWANSFNIVYDKLNTIQVFGELKADISKNIQWSGQATISSFSTDAQAEAWNLPAIEMRSNIDVVFTPKWYAGASVFFVGERKDQFRYTDDTAVVQPTFITRDITLKSFIDLNAHVGYKHSDRITFFLRGHNLTNQNYQRWFNYPVQGIQLLLGAHFKFDF
ncbi:TonB-dependent receptor [Flavobacterium sp.]|uniref:TonB-dependent receptor n=1 Tax=Flavobacterium sp. TaxID=239 RepID=UPI002608BB03|nr:TonB-dependent receptor [Flavobacterium sp.]